MNRVTTPVSLTLCPLFALLLTACIDFNQDLPLPDLDPNTPAGGEILIFEIDDLFEFSSIYNPDYGYQQFADIDRQYDVNSDGEVDFAIFGTSGGSQPNPETSELMIAFTGELLYNSELFFGVLAEGPEFLPADGLSAGAAHALWADPYQPLRLASDSRTFLGGYNMDSNYPPGISYLPTRTAVGSDYYYGWLEIVATDVHDDEYEDWLYISRFGISQTPGLRIRMGQE